MDRSLFAVEERGGHSFVHCISSDMGNVRLAVGRGLATLVARSPQSLTAALAIAGLFLAVAIPALGHAQAPSRGAGTYELTWFSINTVTEQPTIAKLVLVLSSSLLPDSLNARMNPSRGKGRTAPPPRACWRITEGGAAMNNGSSTATSTDWALAGASDITVQLWFIVDAGSALRFTTVGETVRGEITSSGWMSGPSGRAAPRVVRDSVVGRRVGDPDLSRCLG